MECIKLITSPNYMDKRIGYLGLTLLLTDQEEVLMLVTNSLKARKTNTGTSFVFFHPVLETGLTTTETLADGIFSCLKAPSRAYGGNT